MFFKRKSRKSMEMWRFRAVRAGRCALVWGRVGPPDGGHGVSAPAGGLSSGMHPPFSFPSCGKENGPCTVQKKRPLGRAPVQWPSARDGGRREMVPADSRWLSDGRGGVPQRIDSGFPRRGCGGQRVARTHLTSSSFRAFRFATRCPGGRRSGSLAYAAMLHLSSTTGQRQRKEKLDVSQTSPGQRSPHGPGVSVPDCRKGSPAFPRRRQEVCAGAD